MAKKTTDKGKARDAKTGEYVSKDYAKKHRATTVVEHRGKPGASKPIIKKEK